MALAAVEDFQFDAKVGKGAFGSVFVARHTPTNDVFAVKIMWKDEVNEESVMREAILHQSLDHPNILPLLYHLEDNCRHFLFFHLAENGSLEQRIERREQEPLTEEVIIKYMLQVAAGLDHVHTSTIVHRYLKPMNILIFRGDHVLLADFGSAVRKVEGVAITQCCGSPLYMAPEVAAEQAYSFPADIWSLGVSLLEMTHGDLPVEAYTCSADEKQNLIPVTCSPGCRSLLIALLQVDPASRPTAAHLLANPWLQ